MLLKFLSLIKFSHTVFAMPFAIIGYAIGVSQLGFDLAVIAQVILCMIFARSAAMGFNRIVDREYDAKNLRTASREIPSGQISTNTVAWIVAGCCCGFIVTSLTINVLCFFLSPLALLVILGYSYTKRFTSWCHIVLGLALSIAPVGAYVAVTGHFSVLPFVLAFLVIGWVSGFDIIFALQDLQFDRSVGLYSVPARFGVKGALIISAALHLLTVILVVVVGLMLSGHIMWLYWVGAVGFAMLLAVQHIVVTPTNLSRVNLAFATTNGLASLLYGVTTVLAILL